MPSISYASLDGAAAVRRMDLATFTPGLQFGLGSDPFFGPRYVEDMLVLSGSPSSVAVSRKYQGVSPRHAGVAVYDNGVPRPVATSDHTGSNVIEPGTDAEVLYGYNNETTEFGVRRMTALVGGVAVTNTYPSVITGFNVDIRSDNDLIYATTGLAMDPETGDPIGTYTMSQVFGNLVLPESRVGRVYFLTVIGGQTSIQAFDQTTFLPLGSFPIPGVSGTPTSLIRWGQNGLAFRTSANQVFLIETPLIPTPDPVTDFEGDERTDLAVWRPSDGTWYIQNSSNGAFRAEAFGASTDLLAPGDYDGDGKVDIAVWRPIEAIWYIIESATSAFRATQFGVSTDKLVARDYDGDGKTDIAVYRPSEGAWYVLQSSNGALNAGQFGISTDIPVPGDYDRDGKADFAVYRPGEGTWYILQSSNGAFRAQPFGINTDVPVPSDYDGDAKTDIAVFRPSVGFWYILQSATSTLRAVQHGVSTDLPVPGDYDGDRKADLAGYRYGVWRILRSSDDTLSMPQFGLPSDVPVPYGYIR